jgi:hypothetical protein
MIIGAGSCTGACSHDHAACLSYKMTGVLDDQAFSLGPFLSRTDPFF